MAKINNDKVAVQEAVLALVKHQQSMLAAKLRETELKNEVSAAKAKLNGGKK